MINLFEHQKIAIDELRTGSILWGGVGSGKSLTAIAYYYVKECGGSISSDGSKIGHMQHPRDLYIITTARKRDSMDWEEECTEFMISTNREISYDGVKLTVDSWNNIGKYVEVKDAFFVFDEQKVIGSGAWVKAFLKIAKANHWILLTATPGDTWMDYVPVFIANGFYKNRTEFIRKHVVYNNFTNFPKIDHYIDTRQLFKLKEKVLVRMKYERKLVSNNIDIVVPYDEEMFNLVYIKRWNPYENRPISGISEAGYIMRKVVNSNPNRFEAIKELAEKHRRLIVFYSFDYELDILRTLEEKTNFTVAEYNGHLHEDVPTTHDWIYLVNYISGGEAWNCTQTNAVAFYSLHYSYRTTTQAAGRIDRMNTPFAQLYYYYIRSDSPIDLAIRKSLKAKKDFNEAKFLGQKTSRQKHML